MRDAAPILEIRGVRKSFGRVAALRNVDFDAYPGEVLALLGDNGAGKSTMIRILSGVVQADAGTVRWEGEPIDLGSAREAYDAGIATVYQELALVDAISIWRNMFLGREAHLRRGVWPLRWLDRAKARTETRETLAELGIQLRSPDELVEKLSGGQRQSIAIARAMHFRAKLIILDEPVSALSLRQTEEVLASIERARDRGMAIVIISHNLRHVQQIADRIVILSHGESIAEFRQGERTSDQIAEMIMRGRFGLDNGDSDDA
jgi:simple sugar transport system ATP-binding protein